MKVLLIMWGFKSKKVGEDYMNEQVIPGLLRDY